MDWSAIGKDIESVAGDALPLIGGLLGGPLGSKVGSMVAGALGVAATPDAVSQALKTDPDAAVKLKTLEVQQATQLAQIAADSLTAQRTADVTAIQAVNKTIQAEAAGKSWLQRNAQPVCKLAAVAMIFAIYFVLPLAKVPVPDVPESAFMMILAVLGVSAWHDGAAKVAAVKHSGGSNG